MTAARRGGKRLFPRGFAPKPAVTDDTPRLPVSATVTASTEAEVGGPNFFTETCAVRAGVSARTRFVA
jgi:hypothetical protein